MRPRRAFNDRATIGRRGLVRGLVLLGSSLAFARWLGAPPAAGWPALPRGVRVVGEAYLAAHPQEASRERLRALVPGDREALGRRVRRDFAADDVVSVRGRLLARTECRACALAVLT